MHTVAVQMKREVTELGPLDDAPSIRIEAVAAQLNVSFATVQRMFAAGKLKAERIGPRSLRVRPSELARLLSGVESKIKL